MKKKIINGLLFAVVLVAATSSFVSCKDYSGDNYNELQEKYATLQEAFNKQVAAMQEYVLKTTFNNYVTETNGKINDINGKIDEINNETGYNAAELAAKGTIKKRLDDLESYYSTLNGEVSDMNDPTKVGSLAYQIAQNNIAIATANGLIKQVKGLAERDSVYLRSLLAGWDNGGSLGDMVTEASQLLIALKSDTAKYNFAYDTLSTYYQKWNEAVELANQASQFVGTSVSAQGKVFNNLQDMADAYDNAVADLQDQIDALKENVEQILETIQNQVTGIEIQAVYNPIYGTFAYPVDLQSNILAAYYGNFKEAVEFPAGSDDVSAWVGNTPVVLSSELEAIGARQELYKAGIHMKEGAGNAGYLYLTVNPSSVNMEGKEFTLRTSDNQISKVTLSPLEASTVQLKWGYSRAASANGFYVAAAEIKKENAEDVALSFDAMGVANKIQNIMQNWSGANSADIIKILWAINDGLKFDIPRLGVQHQWKDALGWKNYVSKYDLAAVSLKPIGYDFLYNVDLSPAIVKFKNHIIAKEQAFALDVVNNIVNLLEFKLNLSSEGSLEITADGDVLILINPNPVSNGTDDTQTTITIPANTYPGQTLDVTLNTLPDYKDTGKTAIDITPLVKQIQKAIDKKLADTQTAVKSDAAEILNKIIDIENKFFDKAISFAQNPNRYIQPALLASCDQLGYFYPSRLYLAPTQVKRGQTIYFMPTTLTGELVAPAFKKYVAVTGAWNVNDINDVKDASKYNTGALNTVFDGDLYNLQRAFEFTIPEDTPDGTVLEFTYECLGYNGKVAGKKFYIEVYE